ncbi:MAG TPA: glycoside hydrolase family 31 protein [Hanamia sp.]
MKKCIVFLSCIINFSFLNANAVERDTTIQIQKNEYWWGGAVIFGTQMPFSNNQFSFDLSNHTGNQNAPILISNKGRWVWSEKPFAYTFNHDSLKISDIVGSIQMGVAGTDLKSAYKYCSEKFFPASGEWIDSLLITSPQYNLWIELMYNPTQKAVLAYANNVLKNKLPPGALMIDDNWSKYYGELDFDKEKFPDAKKMITSLHQKGFKVMVWICPFISPDSKEFRELADKRYLLLDKGQNDTATWSNNQLQPLIINWWNGYSACLDLTNPGAVRWLKNKLNFLQTSYGIDGFKFDAGDAEFYSSPYLISYKKVSDKEQCLLWAQVGLDYKLNEYRAMWKMGGQPLVQRLRDKSHTWEALQSLIPNTIAQQLDGYTFTCPDMIGGGEFTSFLPGKVINQDLIVRSAQCHALMPMMQFSVAPWRILDTAHLKAVKKAVAIRQEHIPYLMKVFDHSVKTGEPVLRPLEYNFPNENLPQIKDQFMIGDKLMVAPVVTDGFERQVVLPKGKWRYKNKTISGGKTMTFKVPLDELLFFELVKD